MELERQRRSNAEVPSCDAACGTKGGDSVSATGHGAPPPQSSIPVQIPRMPLFDNMDPDIIPEFRPRLGTEVESINDSGYNSSFHDSMCYEQQHPQYPGGGAAVCSRASSPLPSRSRVPRVRTVALLAGHQHADPLRGGDRGPDHPVGTRRPRLPGTYQGVCGLSRPGIIQPCDPQCHV